MKILIELFLTFCKIGLTTFGGGYAMLPVIQREIAENKKWATNEEIMDYYAVGQCTPGVIAVNTATFIGNKIKGFAGSLSATLGVIFPPVVIITVIAALISGFADIPEVIHALAGIKAAVCALIFKAVVTMFKSGVKDTAGFIIFFAVLATGLFTSVSPVIYVLGGALLGVLVKTKTSLLMVMATILSVCGLNMIT